MDRIDGHLETFRQEADELLGEIEAVILLIEENPEDVDAINRLFRAVHTLKGSGGMFGLTDIANFSHGLESVLDKVRGKQLPITHELIDLTLAYRDQVGLMLHAGENDIAVDADLVIGITRRLAALCPPPPKSTSHSSRATALRPCPPANTASPTAFASPRNRACSPRAPNRHCCWTSCAASVTRP